MGAHVDMANSYFSTALSAGRANFAVDPRSNSFKTLHSTNNGMTPISYLAGDLMRSGNNEKNVEFLYVNPAYSALRNWEIEFLVELEELHDYYALLNYCGYPITFSDFRLAVCMTAIRWDGNGEITLPGNQTFKISCE